MAPTMENLVAQALAQTKALGPEYWDHGCPDAEQMWYISENLANSLTVKQATPLVQAIVATPQCAFYGAEIALDNNTPQETVATYLYDMIGKEYDCQEEG